MVRTARQIQNQADEPYGSAGPRVDGVDHLSRLVGRLVPRIIAAFFKNVVLQLELRELGMCPAPAVDEIGAEVEILSHFRNGFAELEQFQHWGFELGCVSLAGLHFHSASGSYESGPEI
jgi:hypothetical protein